MYPRARARPVQSAAPVDAPYDGGLGVTGSVDALLDSMGHSADGKHGRLQTNVSCWLVGLGCSYRQLRCPDPGQEYGQANPRLAMPRTAAVHSYLQQVVGPDGLTAAARESRQRLEAEYQAVRELDGWCAEAMRRHHHNTGAAERELKALFNGIYRKRHERLKRSPARCVQDFSRDCRV